MLIVTIDLVPGGYAPARRTLGTMHIANESNLADISDYSVALIQAANPLTGAHAGVGSCKVISHDRRQSIWKLLARAATEAETADYFEL